jgi:ammonium transporter, Amt family
MPSFSLEIDFAWVSTCIALMILMQAGFICLESGQVRSMNSISVAIKNIIDFCLAAIIFWLFAYGFMFSSSFEDKIVISDLLFSSAEAEKQLFFLFQLLFCCTAVTIISGAIAERMSLSGYFIITIITAGLIYPVTGHWIWSKPETGGGLGWLLEEGFFDYAGSTAVHSIGGWVALASILIIGPRLGRFGKGGENQQFIGTNLPIAAVGAMLLFIGWLGFNGGNELLANDSIPRIFVNTVFGAATGGLTACIVSWWYFGKPNSALIINGLLAGLVAITASCNVISLPAAIVISIVGTIICIVLCILLEKLKIDDVVGAVPVHLGPGIWGTLAVAIFADPALWSGTLDRWLQFKVQCVGVVSCAVYAFGVSYVLLKLVNKWHPLRVSEDSEMDGLNLAEFAIENTIQELAAQMHSQEREDKFDKKLDVDFGSDTRPIAQAYNKVVDKLNYKITELTELKEKLTEQATVDGLTGLYNRRYFNDSYIKEWRLAHRSQQPISLIMIDVDYFKNYNDCYGHQAGDECLKQVAEVLKSSLSRPTDFAVRYGGEEFAIVLPNTDIDGAIVIVESLQKKIREGKIEHKESKISDYLTLSIGVAWAIPVLELNEADMLFEADKALYEAKGTGRDRAVYSHYRRNSQTWYLENLNQVAN